MEISFGLKCTAKDDPLQRISLEEVGQLIKHGEAHDLKKMTWWLRQLNHKDQTIYRRQKTQLPYFSCSLFEPAIRKLDNFRQANGLILDIDFQDHSGKTILARVREDHRVVMGFTSPNGCGFKLVFEFSESCTNAEKYKTFYRHFALALANQYGIVDHLDLQNCDGSRICFICYDPVMWYNPNAEKIAVDPDPVEETDLMVQGKAELSDDILKQIRARLGGRVLSGTKIIRESEELEQLKPFIINALQAQGLLITECRVIHYGLKIRFSKGVPKGEINIYKGKKGFSVVTVAKGELDERISEYGRRIAEYYLTGR